ncbi:MAG: hypothetical protein ACYTG7_03730 [Planctomycetota bacterium]
MPILFLCFALVGVGVLLYHGYIAGYFPDRDLALLHMAGKASFAEALSEGLIHSSEGKSFQPLADLAIFIQARLFGNAFPAFALVNLVLHLANIFLLYRIARFLSGPIGAGCTAFFFAWHPLIPALLAGVTLGMQCSLLLLFLLLGACFLIAFIRNKKAWNLLPCLIFILLALACGLIRSYDFTWFPEILCAADLSAETLTAPANETTGTVIAPIALPVLAGIFIILGWLLAPLYRVKVGRYGLNQIPLLLAGLLFAYYAFRTLTLTPEFLEAGKLNHKLQAQVCDLVEEDFSEKDPVFLLDLPAPRVLPFRKITGGGASDLPSALSLAFMPPFSERSLKVYPMRKAPYLSNALHTPFMLHTWGEGMVLRYDAAAGGLRKLNADERSRALLLEYMKKYCEDEKLHLLDIKIPIQNMTVRLGEEGFPLQFPYRQASLYRIVIVTRSGIVMREEADLFPDRITREGKKPFVKLQIMDQRLRAALLYFNREPAYLWVEAVDEQGEVFFRSKFLRIRII